MSTSSSERDRPRDDTSLVSELHELRLQAGQPSLRTMAKAGTISHATIAAVLHGKGIPRWETVRAIVEILGGDADKFHDLWTAEHHPPPGSAAAPLDYRFAARYRDALKHFYGKISVPDFTTRRLAPINDLYVSPTISSIKDDGTSLPDLLDLEKVPRHLVLLGNPGSGKSVISQALMYQMSTSDTRTPTPFLIVLRQFTSPDHSPQQSVVQYLEQILTTFYQLDPPTGWVQRTLESTALVIFDGLDELLDIARRNDMAAIIERFSDEFPAVRVIVTSRPTGYAASQLDPKLFVTYKIADLDEERVARYAHKWFTSIEVPQRTGVQIEQSFIRESKIVADLRSNPLMLSLLCVLYRDTGSIPRNRVRVYESCSDLLLNRWDQVRGIKPSALEERRLTRPLIGHLAFWMLSDGDGGASFPKRKVVQKITDFLSTLIDPYEATFLAQEFLDYLRNRIWVLTEVGAGPEGELYSFTHRSFLEYFAAEHIARISASPADLADALIPRLSLSNWKLVAEIAADRIGNKFESGADNLVRSLLAKSQGLPADHHSKVIEFVREVAETVELAPATLRLIRSTLGAS